MKLKYALLPLISALTAVSATAGAAVTNTEFSTSGLTQLVVADAGKAGQESLQSLFRDFAGQGVNDLLAGPPPCRHGPQPRHYNGPMPPPCHDTRLPPPPPPPGGHHHHAPPPPPPPGGHHAPPPPPGGHHHAPPPPSGRHHHAPPPPKGGHHAPPPPLGGRDALPPPPRR